MTKLLLAILSMFVSVAAFSQRAFVPGYIVTTAGDTLRGEIENRDWKANPSFVKFRKVNESETEYSSLQLKAFYLERENELFQSFRMMLDQMPNDPQYITPANYNAKAEKSFFAKVLVRGVVSLYHVYDFRSHYIVDKGGAFQELRIQYTIIKANSLSPGRQVINALDLYKQQLSSLFKDCPSLVKKTSRVSLRAKPLQALVLEYNSCKGVSPSFIQKEEQGRNESGIVAGATVTTNSITGRVHPHLVNSTYRPVVAATGGIFFNHVFARNHGKIAWYNELSYVSFHAVSTYTDVSLYETRSENHSSFSYIQFFSGARFRFERYRLSPFFAFGLSSSFAMKAEFYTHQERYLNGQFVDSNVINYPTESFTFGLWANTGVALTKRLDLQLRIHKTQGYTSAISYKSSVSHYFLTAAYKLNRP